MLPSIASLILALIPAAHGPDSSLNLLSSSTTCLTNRLYGLGIWTLRDRQYVLLSIAWTGKEGTLIHALKTSSPWRVDVSLKQTIGGTFSWYVALSWRPAVRASLCLLHVNSRWKCRCCWWWEMDAQNALKAHWVSQVSGIPATLLSEINQFSWTERLIDSDYGDSYCIYRACERFRWKSFSLMAGYI